jgi:hypothetical protein
MTLATYVEVPTPRRSMGLDRVDVYVDGRPRTSSDVTDGDRRLTVPDVAGATTVQVQGFAVGTLLAARTASL